MDFRRNSKPAALPRLLVSVRNVAEAEAALSGGCDLLDIKEPDGGPLGMAAVEEIAAIVETARKLRPEVPVSAAVGELSQWVASGKTPEVPDGLSFVKVGLAGTGSGAGWKQACLDFWRTMPNTATPRWVITTYADWIRADCPRPGDVVLAIAELDLATNACPGLVVDTFDKTQPSLPSHIEPEKLIEMTEILDAAGSFLALAGKLAGEDLPELRAANPHIIGVRSAVCREGVRQRSVEESLVRAFRLQMHEVWVGVAS